MNGPGKRVLPLIVGVMLAWVALAAGSAQAGEADVIDVKVRRAGRVRL